jgi:monovalent cation:H+ antiporter-2, CPA2 family
VLALLVLEDLSMAFYLPILTALVAGAGLREGVRAEGIAVAAIIVVLFVALRFGGFINRLVFSTDDEVLLLRVFGLALLVAGIAEQVQVSSAVGAFLIGIALSGRVAESARAVLAPLRDLFAAVFFVFFGLDTDPLLIPPAIVPAVILAVATAGTKFMTGCWAAARSGIGPLGRVRAGSIIVARGEFNIVIAGLAASTVAGFGALAAAYVLLMAISGPIIARFSEPVAAKIMGSRLPRQPPGNPTPL